MNWMDEASRLDNNDSLARFDSRFIRPMGNQETRIAYLCGHSLGLCPKGARQLVEAEMDAWGNLGVLAHTQGERPWVNYHEQVACPLATLLGAFPNEVIAMNSLTVNLHLMLVSFYRPTGKRKRIIIEKNAFPSDRYAVVSHLAYHGLDPEENLIEVSPAVGRSYLSIEEIEKTFSHYDEEVALVLWPGVQYLTGQAFDIGRLTHAAHAIGAYAGFDLAHAIGNIPLSLHQDEADFAVWCSYKYLNGGPGAVGGCFIHRRLSEDFRGPRFTGWWGHNKSSRFRMGKEFDPIPGAEGWQLSNPPILSLAPLLASLELFDKAGIKNLREKSLSLSRFLRLMLQETLSGHVSILTPSQDHEHGAQLTLRLEYPRDTAQQIFNTLENSGVICDWREPGLIRVAPAPLYNSHADCVKFIDSLNKAIV